MKTLYVYALKTTKKIVLINVYHIYKKRNCLYRNGWRHHLQCWSLLHINQNISLLSVILIYIILSKTLFEDVSNMK